MLTFPTDAEKCLADWREGRGHKSLTKTAEARGAFRDDEWPAKIVYVFPDETTIEVQGRGRNYTATACLP